MFSRLATLSTVCVAVVLAAGTRPPFGVNPAVQPPPSRPDREATTGNYDRQAPPPAEDPKRQKMIDTFSRRLGQMKPFGGGKKNPDDYFLLGTAELNRATGHADVRFEVMQGQREVAGFLADYIAAASRTSLRKWHVFYRLKDAEKAEQALQFTRSQYDQLASYREQLRKTYNARTIRRT